MVYLDYSATTPVKVEVLDTFNKVSKDFVGNANSIHNLGVRANDLIEKSTEQIKKILQTEMEVIYTSGSSEANNLALKGIAYKYKSRGKHIITSKFEHSSVKKVLDFLAVNGFEVTYLEPNEDGLITVEALKKVIRDDTILVTINHINSELGLKQDIEEIGKFLKNYPKCFFHVDLTQSIGKVNVSLDNIDLASFSAHKIYGLKGIGCLLKKKNIMLEPLIHGGKSTTIYRSGTPAHPLIASFSKALRLVMDNSLEKYDYVKMLNEYLKDNLKDIKDVVINSNSYAIPHILNISVLNIKPETMIHALEEYDIYISTKSACSDDFSFSESVYNLTKDMDVSKSSLRISLSYMTTKEELDYFIEKFKICLEKLSLK